MTVVEALFLGAVQGLTEFLPVSSKTHLVVVPALFGMPSPDLAFIVLLHLGTVVALLAALAREVWTIATDLTRPRSEGRRLAWLLVLASIPASVVGLLFEETFERLLSRPPQVAFSLVATAVLLVGAELIVKRRDRRLRGSAGRSDAIGMGLAQAVALLPGVSRAGSTMAAGLALGLRRDEAARFSFLMAIPVILGANAVELPELVGAGFGVPELAGFAAAAISGYAAVAVLLRYLRRRTFLPFAAYCAVFAIVAGIALV